MANVWEDPGGLNYETDYQYDALGNMLRVDQKGSAPTDSTQWRTRLFTYDSLSRLLTANNPESGLITYFYDNNGNLTQKVMPSPNQAVATNTHTISYCYDALNRVTGKAYSWQNCQNGQLPAGTAAVSYKYDESTNGKSHLTSLTDQAGSGTYNYDVLGRMSNESRMIAGVTKTMSYTYNLDGSMATMTYPSATPGGPAGDVITYTQDAAGRMLSVKDIGNPSASTSGQAINYVSGAAYNAPSMLTASTYGQNGSFTGILNTLSYNSRLQPVNLVAYLASPSGRQALRAGDHLLDAVASKINSVIGKGNPAPGPQTSAGAIPKGSPAPGTQAPAAPNQAAPAIPGTKPTSLPVDGPPGSTATKNHPDGSPKQIRQYGPDCKAKTDTDFHPNPAGNPHAHDWEPSPEAEPLRGVIPVPFSQPILSQITTEVSHD